MTTTRPQVAHARLTATAKQRVQLKEQIQHEKILLCSLLKRICRRPIQLNQVRSTVSHPKI